MTDLFAGWRFAIRRLRTGWRFMIVAALGVLVASTLLAITPIYSAAMSDLGLQFRLDDELTEDADRLAVMEVGQLQLGGPTDRAIVEAMDRITEARVGWLGDEVLTEDRSQRFDVTFPGYDSPSAPIEVSSLAADPVRQDWGGYVYHLAGWEDHVEVVEGRFPEISDGRPEVVLIDGFQRHAALGDTVRILAPGLDDCPDIPPTEGPGAAEEVRCRPTTVAAGVLDVTVVGFIRPRDTADPRWLLFGGSWDVTDAPILPRPETAGDADYRLPFVQAGIGQMLMFTTDEQYEQVFRERLPEATGRHRAGVYVDTARIGLGEVAYAADDIRAWRDDLRDGLGLLAVARIDILDTLDGFQTSRSFSAVPLLVVLLQVVGIVVYYVAMVMAMLLERQREEVGVFRSRGATTGQLVGLSFVEGLVLAVPAFAIAPWLAAQVVSQLGRTPTFEAITGGGSLPTQVSPEAYLLAAGGAVFSLLAILLPSFLAVRRGVVDVKRQEARPALRNAFQRYYLDFALVGLAGLLLWQLDQQGSVFDPDSVGGWSSDPLLLLAPFVLILAVSVMVLRFYPLAVRWLVRALLVFRGTGAAIGLRRAGRAPASYGRVALLVIMAVAVGTFAASYGPTVDRSLEQRARYEAGVDYRAAIWDPDDEEAVAALEAMGVEDGVRVADGVYRGQIRTMADRPVSLLAIDPEIAETSLWWRDDFSEATLQQLMRLLRSEVPPGGGYLLEPGLVAVDLMLNSGMPDRIFLQAQFRDEHGQYADTIGEFERVPDQWVRVRFPLPEREASWTFAGLIVTDRIAALRMEGSAVFDRLAAVSASGRETVLDDFGGPMRWVMLDATSTEEQFAQSASGGLEGSQGLEWTWLPLVWPQKRILAPSEPAVPLSVLMDDRAMGEFGVFDGRAMANIDGVELPLNVRAQVDYFPTMNPEQGIVIANLDHLRAAASLIGFEDYSHTNEIWVDFEPGTSLAAQRLLAERLAEEQQVLPDSASLQASDVARAAADPTVQAAGAGILSVAFVAVFGLCAVGFVVTMVVSARSRSTEFAVLRAVGASRPEILRALVLEWGVVLVAGGIIGGIVGRQVARIMLGFLNVTEDGSTVLPPFLLLTDWRTLGVGLGVLAGVVVASLLAAWLASMRRSPTVELRLTQ